MSMTRKGRSYPAELYARCTRVSAARSCFSALQALIVMWAVACTDPMSVLAPPNRAREVAALSITPAEIPSIAIGRLVPIQAIARDESGAVLTNVPITWSTSDPEVVGIHRTSSGTSSATQLVAERAGVATLTATSGRSSASVMITVRAPGPVATISIFCECAVAAGKTTQLSVQQQDSDGVVLRLPAPTYASSDSSIARVSSTGLLVAVAQGSATVTAASDGKRAVRQILVTAPEHAFMWTAATGLLDLETLPGFVSSKAVAVSPVGHVAGTLSTIADSLLHAFVRSPGASGTMRDLSGLPGGGSSEAFSVNSSGQVVGYATTKAGARHAVLWEANGEIRDLGTLDGGHSAALGINDAGLVVGWTAKGTLRQPFMWTESTGMRAMVGVSYGTAYAITQSGFIVGEGDNRPVQWSGNAAASPLYLLPRDQSGRAVAISSAGHIVGTSGGCADDYYLDDCGDLAERPVMWTNASAPVDLRKNSSASSAIASVLGVNSALQIVGSSALHHAMLSSTDGVRDLGVLPGRVWSVATAINDAGLVVGSSLNP